MTILSRRAASPSPPVRPANQLRTVARHRISKRLGRLEAGELEALDRAISIQLGFRREP